MDYREGNYLLGGQQCQKKQVEIEENDE